MEPDRIVLEHIRSLLLALAVLVERAAGLPIVARLQFLAVMAGGEAEARRLIVAMASERCPGDPCGLSASHPAADPCPSAPNTAAGQSALLAARLRMLALVVSAMLAQAVAEPLCRHAAPAFLPGRRPRRAASQFTLSPAHRATSPP